MECFLPYVNIKFESSDVYMWWFSWELWHVDSDIWTPGPQFVALFGDAVGGVALLEEVCRWGWALRDYNLALLLVCLPYCMFKDVTSQCLASATISASCHHGFQPWWALTLWNCKSINSLFYKILLVMVLCYSSRKVTNTICFTWNILRGQEMSKGL